MDYTGEGKQCCGSSYTILFGDIVQRGRGSHTLATLSVVFKGFLTLSIIRASPRAGALGAARVSVRSTLSQEGWFVELPNATRVKPYCIFPCMELVSLRSKAVLLVCGTMHVGPDSLNTTGPILCTYRRVLLCVMSAASTDQKLW